MRRRIGAKSFIERVLSLSNQVWREQQTTTTNKTLSLNNTDTNDDISALKLVQTKIPKGFAAFQRASRAAQLEVDVAATSMIDDKNDLEALIHARNTARRLLQAQPDDLTLFGALASVEHRFVFLIFLFH